MYHPVIRVDGLELVECGAKVLDSVEGRQLEFALHALDHLERLWWWDLDIQVQESALASMLATPAAIPRLRRQEGAGLRCLVKGANFA